MWTPLYKARRKPNWKEISWTKKISEKFGHKLQNLANKTNIKFETMSSCIFCALMESASNNFWRMNSLLTGFQMTFNCSGGSQCYQLHALEAYFPGRWVPQRWFWSENDCRLCRDPGKCRTAELRRQNGLIWFCLPGLPDIPWASVP